ncbi:tyrosine-type recombinase/integrase [Ramlibacter rhizophilus]|nr:site-specific integrase [Ramlibacter rhizophilus]
MKLNGRTAKLHLLTVRQVQSAGEGDHSDGGGLMLRVRGVSSSWVLRYTSPAGRRREMGLGAARRSSSADAGGSLALARKLAREARDQVQEGRDPITERDHQRAAARDAEEAARAKQKRQHLTLCRAAREYHERVIEPRLSSKHAAQWLASLENHMLLDTWHKPIAEITPAALLAALQTVRPHERARNVTGSTVPETLNRIRQRLDAIFEDAIFHGHCTSNPAAAIRRKMREVLPARRSRQLRALEYREAPTLMAKLRKTQGVSARCLELALLTAARTSEVLGAEWSEFDLVENTWTIPAERMKAGEAHVVHLSEDVREIVLGQRGLDTALLFPSPTKPGKPMSNMALLATLDRLSARAQTTVHGLCRATFSTWAYDTGAARPDVIEACLAHKEADRVKAAYNRAQFTTERRTLMESWARFLLSGDS